MPCKHFFSAQLKKARGLNLRCALSWGHIVQHFMLRLYNFSAYITFHLLTYFSPQEKSITNRQKMHKIVFVLGYFQKCRVKCTCTWLSQIVKSNNFRTFLGLKSKKQENGTVFKHFSDMSKTRSNHVKVNFLPCIIIWVNIKSKWPK